MLDVSDFVYRNFDVVNDTGTDLGVNCINCDDYKQHLMISLDKSTCHCFRCDYAASWVGLVMAVTGFDYPRALGELYVVPKPVLDRLPELFAVSIGNDEISRPSQFVLPDGYISLYDELSGHVRDSREAKIIAKYLKKRGFGPWYFETYQIGYVPGEFRAYIPIEGDYWQARAVVSWVEPKYMSPPNPSNDVIFNSNALERYDEVVICEGALSAMAVGENSVALVGKNPTRRKLRRLLASSVKAFSVVIEKGAEYQMIELADELSAGGKNVNIWRYDGDQDPADWAKPKEDVWDFGTKLGVLLS